MIQMKPNGLFVALILSSWIGAISAAPYYSDITAVGTSAEMLGIGGVQGFSQQASVILETPAGLSYAKNSFSGFYTSFYGGADYMTTAFSCNPRPELTLAVGAAYQRSAALDATATNNSNEYVASNQFDVDVLQATIGVDYRLLNSIHLALSWTEYASNLYNVQGSGADWSIGLRSQTPIGDFIATQKNIYGNKITFTDGSYEALPREWSIGYKSLPTPFLDSEIFAQIKHIDGIDSLIKNVGIRVYPLESKTLSLSLGYKDKVAVSSFKETIAAGAILHLGSLSIQYGYDTTDAYEGQQQHYVSFGIKY